jgi:hypothetical protein
MTEPQGNVSHINDEESQGTVDDTVCAAAACVSSAPRAGVGRSEDSKISHRHEVKSCLRVDRSATCTYLSPKPGWLLPGLIAPSNGQGRARRAAGWPASRGRKQEARQPAAGSRIHTQCTRWVFGGRGHLPPGPLGVGGKLYGYACMHACMHSRNVQGYRTRGRNKQVA